MNPHCHIELLGPLRLVRDGLALTRFGTRKAAALLAYLALRPGPHPREQILDQFWPDMDLPSGRNNLNTALSGLRRLLEPPGTRRGSILMTTHVHAGVATVAVTTDVAEFESCLQQARNAPDLEARVGLLRRATALYRADFQPGNYQEWAVREAGRLQAGYVEALDGLAGSLESLGEYAEAAAVTHTRLALDPYTEEVHVDLVRRHVLSGQTGAAQTAVRALEQIFQQEFGAGPSQETRRVLETLLNQTRPRVAKPSQRPSFKPPTEDFSAFSEAASPTLSSLPLLPFWLSRFFGRDTEMARLAEMVSPLWEAKDDANKPPCRLVTLTGPGGVGKTRLAAEFTKRVAQTGELWCGFVPLADLSTVAQVPIQIVQTLGLTPTPNVASMQQILEFLSRLDRPALLILDNLEHLLEADAGTADALQKPLLAQTVQTLLTSVNHLTVLCTSRRRLGLQGEQAMPLGPLPVPPPPDLMMAEDTLGCIAHVPSVRLYVDRAQTVRPDFGLTTTNAPAVASLCRVLEGSPLALELAASWVRLLPPRKMWERLNGGHSLPAGDYADLPARHRSLPAALTWSWRLLPEAQQRLLARMSMFRGGWTLPSAEAVGGEPDTLELLAGLQEASLVMVQEEAEGDIRYSLLETVRRYAGEQLAQDSDPRKIQDRHRDFFLDLAQKAGAELRGPQQSHWLRQLDAEHDNLRVALEHCLSTEAAEQGLRLAGALWLFWRTRGHITEGRQWLERMLACASGLESSEAFADALLGAGNLALAQSEYSEARRLYEESLAIWRQIGDERGIAALLNNLGVMAADQGDYALARTLHTEVLAIRQRQENEAGVARCLYNLGVVANLEGQASEAQTLYTESLAIRRRLGDEVGIADALGSLGWVAEQRGEKDIARTLHTESLKIRRSLGAEIGIAESLDWLGNEARQRGDLSAAHAYHTESLGLWRRLGSKFYWINSLEHFAALTAALERWEQTARLLGAVQTLRETIGCPAPAASQRDVDSTLSQVRDRLPQSVFEAAWAAGQAMTGEQAIDDARQAEA